VTIHSRHSPPIERRGRFREALAISPNEREARRHLNQTAIGYGVHGCSAAWPGRALRIVPIRRGHYLVARLHVRPVHRVGARSGLSAVPGPPGATVLRIPTAPTCPTCP